jgi:hypothetical protein
VRAPSEGKSDNSENSFYEELEQAFFNHFLKHHIISLFGDFNAKVGRENVFTRIVNESLYQDSKDNGVRTVNFATAKNLILKSTMFLHRNIHKFTWTSPVGKTHNQTDHILLVRRWNSSILDV